MNVSASDSESIREEYASSLTDLTFNSKPIINSLTIIAGENSQAAEIIVDAIEDRIRSVCFIGWFYSLATY